MKMEGLIVNETYVGSPARAERDFVLVVLGFFAISGQVCGWGAIL